MRSGRRSPRSQEAKAAALAVEVREGSLELRARRALHLARDADDPGRLLAVPGPEPGGPLGGGRPGAPRDQVFEILEVIGRGDSAGQQISRSIPDSSVAAASA